MNDCLVVVDMQNDFITGSLGTKEAENIVNLVANRIRKHQGPICITLDTHDNTYSTTQEGHHLPINHCIKDSDGWLLAEPIALALAGRNPYIFEKSSFGSPELATFLAKSNREKMFTSLSFVGVCTDICVISNVMLTKSFLPNVPIYVDGSLCAGVTPESHQNALNAMQACQVMVQNA